MLPERYCVIDVETTGLRPAQDRIVEVACALVQRGPNRRPMGDPGEPRNSDSADCNQRARNLRRDGSAGAERYLGVAVRPEVVSRPHGRRSLRQLRSVLRRPVGRDARTLYDASCAGALSRSAESQEPDVTPFPRYRPRRGRAIRSASSAERRADQRSRLDCVPAALRSLSRR